MPYPFNPPKNKHDLQCPAEAILLAQPLATLAQILEAIQSTSDTPLLTSVYSYADGPQPPLSRILTIVGVANIKSDASFFDQQFRQNPSTIAVKRADGKYASQLTDSDRSHSQMFGHFIQRLHREQLVAIISSDKYGRFGVLQPNVDVTTSGELQGQDFCCPLYIVKVATLRDYISKHHETQLTTEQSSTKRNDEHWKPHGENGPTKNDATEFWKPPSATIADEDSPTNNTNSFWKPPGAGTDADSPTDNHDGFWKPPGLQSNEDDDHWNNGANDSAWNTNTNNDAQPMDTTTTTTTTDDAFHADKGAAAADAFYSDLIRELDTRHQSRILHMRAFNGWVKATQIQELDPRTSQKQLRVLDLACGKGGDLGKWILQRRGVQNYVGIDVARGSLVDAAVRARKMKKKLKQCTLTCADLGADVPGRLKSPKHKFLQKLSTWSLHREPDHFGGLPEFKMVRGGGIALTDQFDVVSIQFAIHYMMQTRKRARRFFRTVSDLLEIGGNMIATTIDARVVVEHLMNLGLDLPNIQESTEPIIISVGGGSCRIQFEPKVVHKIFYGCGSPDSDDLFGLQYTFTLQDGSDLDIWVGDAVNLPEWLIPIPIFKLLGEEAGLELEYTQNFHEFFSIRKDPKEYTGAHSSLYNMKVLNRNGSISEEEYEISRLYAAFKFRKVRESTMKYDDDEDAVDEEEANEIDPAVKAKFLPMALLKAKKANPDWSNLPSAEKNRLTDIELRKLA